MAANKARKEETRRAIIEKAAARFRRDGIAAVGLRPLVADAGLTHGAFYAHFPSRDDLVAEAVGAALADTLAMLRDVAHSAPEAGQLEALIGSYLSERHRVAMARGCAGAALAPEVARGDAAVRDAFGRGVDRIVALIAGLLPPGGTDIARVDRSRAIFAGMMGTLQLARTCDEADAGRLLAGGRAAALATARLRWD